MIPTMEQYPRRIRVRRAWYTIEFSDQQIIYAGIVCRGITCPEDKIITLDPDWGDRLMFRTLVHEVIHCFEFEYEIKIPHALVYALEKPVADFVYHNFFKKRAKRM